MHQTISGETRKVEIFKRKSVDIFLEENKNLFDKLNNSGRSALYENKKLINDPVLNYLNTTESKKYSAELKKIIRREFDACEKIYPYMGDMFVNIFFNKLKNRKSQPFIFKKSNQLEFLKTIKNDHVRQIADIFFKKLSLEYFADVRKEKTDQITIIKQNDLNFDIEFDYDYFVDKGKLKIENYNFIIVDGIIDTVGEIHHLLQKASENKENYVIFCYGVNDEVKHTILNNNRRRITKVYPIDIKVTEESLNILNDIAVISNDEVISALKGQTISQSIRKRLKKGKRITIQKNKFSIERVCSMFQYKTHKDFLMKRIENANIKQTNVNYIKKRYKRFNAKTLILSIPESLFFDNEFIRELDYFLRFVSKSNLKMIKIKNINNKKYYYIPQLFLRLLNEKVEQLNKIYSNISTLIIER
jgi:hypothetical protein